MDTKTRQQAVALFKLDEAPSSMSVSLLFEGHTIEAPGGISVAAALLLNGIEPFRTTPVTAAPRAPFCMMGVCFDCLVEIDHVPSRQACQCTVRQGMVVNRQHGASELELSAEGTHDER